MPSRHQLAAISPKMNTIPAWCSGGAAKWGGTLWALTQWWIATGISHRSKELFAFKTFPPASKTGSVFTGCPCRLPRPNPKNYPLWDSCTIPRLFSQQQNSSDAPIFSQVEHQRALDRYHFAQVQLRTATQLWHRDHQQLQARALVTLEEARHAHQEELEYHRDRQHQLDVCSQLRDKVCECDTHVTVLSLS